MKKGIVVSEEGLEVKEEADEFQKQYSIYGRILLKQKVRETIDLKDS